MPSSSLSRAAPGRDPPSSRDPLRAPSLSFDQHPTDQARRGNTPGPAPRPQQPATAPPLSLTSDDWQRTVTSKTGYHYSPAVSPPRPQQPLHDRSIRTAQNRPRIPSAGVHAGIFPEPPLPAIRAPRSSKYLPEPTFPRL
jgi:hypothetical protein